MRKRANGEGTVYPRKNKHGKIISYRASYWAQTASGPIRRYVSGKTKTEAQVALRKATAERDSGLFFEVENITLAEYLNRWLNGPVKTKYLQVNIESPQLLADAGHAKQLPSTRPLSRRIAWASQSP